MKVQIVLIIMILITGLWAESLEKGEKMKTTDSGLQYVITHQTEGDRPAKGDNVTVHYTGKLTNGNVFDSSYNRNEPFTFTLGQGEVIKGWDEGIALLRKGEKATLKIPANLGYGSQDMGTIPANSTLIFDVELIDFKPAPKIEPYSIEGKEVHTTESGLQYVIVEKGNGEKAIPGKNVSVHYSGFLEDGSMFDSSVKRNQPFRFPLGAGRVIKGWDEGVQLMNVGDKYHFIIPYQLGYGEKGYPPIIPPKSTLLFDVELLSNN